MHIFFGFRAFKGLVILNAKVLATKSESQRISSISVSAESTKSAKSAVLPTSLMSFLPIGKPREMFKSSVITFYFLTVTNNHTDSITIPRKGTPGPGLTDPRGSSDQWGYD